MAKNKKLVDQIAERFGGNREVAQHALDSVVDAITRSLAAGEKVVVKGLGVFDRDKAATGKAKKKKRVVPTFNAADELKDVVAGAKKVRAKVLESLSVVPAEAAAVAERATRAASSAARAAADLVRGDDSAASTAPVASPPVTRTAARQVPARKTAVKKTAAKKTVAKKATPAAKKTSAAKTTTAAKKATTTAAKKAAPAKTTTAAKKAAPAKKTAAKKTTTRTPPARKAL